MLESLVGKSVKGLRVNPARGRQLFPNQPHQWPAAAALPYAVSAAGRGKEAE